VHAALQKITRQQPSGSRCGSPTTQQFHGPCSRQALAEESAAVPVETGIESCEPWFVARWIDQQHGMQFERPAVLLPLNADRQCGMSFDGTALLPADNDRPSGSQLPLDKMQQIGAGCSGRCRTHTEVQFRDEAGELR
jgi:hypothetical protein